MTPDHEYRAVVRGAKTLRHGSFCMRMGLVTGIQDMTMVHDPSFKINEQVAVSHRVSYRAPVSHVSQVSHDVSLLSEIIGPVYHPDISQVIILCDIFRMICCKIIGYWFLYQITANKKMTESK